MYRWHLEDFGRFSWYSKDMYKYYGLMQIAMRPLKELGRGGQGTMYLCTKRSWFRTFLVSTPNAFATSRFMAVVDGLSGRGRSIVSSFMSSLAPQSTPFLFFFGKTLVALMWEISKEGWCKCRWVGRHLDFKMLEMTPECSCSASWLFVHPNLL